MEVIRRIDEMLHSGDPIIRSWCLVDTYYQPLLLSFLYVLFVTHVGPYIMKDRKPFHLRTAMIVYNFFVVATYVTCLIALAYFFLTTDSYQKICSPTYVRFNHYTYWATSTGWCLYIMKYVEFADTIFFILRKKYHLITNLHVIHHAVLPLIAFIMLRTETTGFQFIPGVINSVVHVLMYSYYGLAAMGPKYQKYIWWKEYLTKLQMLQFVIIMVMVTVLIPLLGCMTSLHGIYIDIVFAFVFFALFFNFYIKTYRKKPRDNSDKKKNSHDLNSNSHGKHSHATTNSSNNSHKTD